MLLLAVVVWLLERREGKGASLVAVLIVVWANTHVVHLGHSLVWLVLALGRIGCGGALLNPNGVGLYGLLQYGVDEYERAWGPTLQSGHRDPDTAKPGGRVVCYLERWA